MKAIGIIANPASGKDIRRMIAYGTCIDNSDKVNIVRRIIMGACITDVNTIYYMKDYYEIVEQAVAGIYGEHRHLIKHICFQPLDMLVFGVESDTVVAAQLMRAAGVKCLITLGGDGTNRAVAKECGNVPIIPISTGTNNVFPKMIEGTIAGMAGGVYASGRLEPCGEHTYATKRLEISKNGDRVDMALVDIVVLENQQIGARAMWKTEAFTQIFLASCTIENIGVSSVGGMLQEISPSESRGLYIKTSTQGKQMKFPIAPGLIGKVGIEEYRIMEMNEKINVTAKQGVIAVDGEKELLFEPGSDISIKLTWNGPNILDVRKVLSDARENRLFYI